MSETVFSSSTVISFSSFFKMSERILFSALKSLISLRHFKQFTGPESIQNFSFSYQSCFSSLVNLKSVPHFRQTRSLSKYAKFGYHAKVCDPGFARIAFLSFKQLSQVHSKLQSIKLPWISISSSL